MPKETLFQCVSVLIAKAGDNAAINSFGQYSFLLVLNS